MIRCLLGLAFVVGSFHPVEPVGDPQEAVRAYRAGRYQEAFSLFRASLPGSPRGEWFYNLGNCAYRLGRHAEAALYYRRALLRLPGDRQVAFNLSLAEKQLGIPPSDGSFGTAVIDRIDSLTTGELLMIVVILESLGLLGLLLVPRQRVAGRRCMMVFVAIALLGSLRLVQVQWFPGSPEAVVMTDTLALRRQPHDSTAVILELKAGERLSVEEWSERWARVEHAGGIGWVRRAGIGLVD